MFFVSMDTTDVDLYMSTGAGGGEFDGYFDINTIYLNVSGFGLRDW